MTSGTQFETFDAWCVVEHYPGDEETLGQDTPKTVFVDRRAAYELMKTWNKRSIDSEYFVKGVRLTVDIENLPMLPKERTCHNFGGEEGTNGEQYEFACSACGFIGDILQPNYCPNCGAKVVQDGE